MRPLPIACTARAADFEPRWRRDFAINLALGGLWSPVAKRHAQQFLLEHTVVDGTPLEVVDARKSRWPAVVLLLVFVALRLASEFGHGPPMPLVIAGGVLLIPFVWRTMAARAVESVRWRGRQPRFTATWAQVYAASWPLLVLGLAWAAAEPWVTAAAAGAAGDARAAWIVGVLAAILLAVPLLVRLQVGWQRLRWRSTVVGSDHVEWAGRYAPVLRVWATSLAAIVACALPVVLLRRLLLGSSSVAALGTGPATAVLVAGLLAAWLLSTPARAWHEARLFALRWDGVRLGATARVRCDIDARAFARLRTRHAWRALLTFGRSRPQALVDLHRAKLRALRIDIQDGG